jgi:hypothetical protein
MPVAVILDYTGFWCIRGWSVGYPNYRGSQDDQADHT